MPLSFRLTTVFLVISCFGFGIFKMALGLLGQGMKKKLCAGYVVYFCAAFWVEFLIFVLAKETQAGLFHSLAVPSIHMVVLGLFLAKGYRVPLPQTLTAAALGNFIVYTVYNVVSAAAAAYSPVFDGMYLYVLTTIYIPYLSGLLAAVLVSWILRRSGFYRYFSHLFAGRYRGALTFGVSYGLMCVWPLSDWMRPDSPPDGRYAAFFFALIVAGLFVVQFLAMYAAGQDRIRAQEETIAQQQAHMELLEELRQEIRAFRHDVTNLFSGLTLQAQEGDLAGIQEFMRETSSYFDVKLGNEIQQMDGLRNVRPYALRSLLAAKLAAMRKMHIRTVLEVLYPIESVQRMGTEDLLRALGILLDNAMEAVPQKGGEVRVVLLQEERELYLAVANNYEVRPDLSALTRKGYTTKGGGHGTGLSSYRKIVSGYQGCVSRTYIKEDMFVQELHIPAPGTGRGWGRQEVRPGQREEYL